VAAPLAIGGLGKLLGGGLGGVGKTLFGQERSGTPLETRGATGQLGSLLQNFLQGGGQGQMPFQRQGADSLMSLLGFDPTGGGLLQGAVGQSLTNPADRTSGLFAALQPFEDRTTNRAVADLREQFSGTGNRFNTNLLTAEGDLRSRLGEGFAKNRAESLLTAQGQQNQAIGQLLQGILGGQGIMSGEHQNFLNNLFSFLQPGAANWQQGIFGDIAGAAGTAAGAGAFG